LAGISNWVKFINSNQNRAGLVRSFVPLHSHTLATHLHVHPVRHT
jgi:hypothetical protein